MQVIIEEPSVVDVGVIENVVRVSVAQLAGSVSLVAAAADVDMTSAVEGALPVYRASSQKFEVRKLITISSSAPSGGQNGDIWLRYAP